MIRRTREERDALVSQWRASGKKMVDWCREQQIPITTFCGWAYAKKAPKGHAVAARSDFTELPGAGSLTSPSLQDFAGDLCKILASSELYFACITLPGPFSPFRSVFGRLRGPICRTFLLGNSCSTCALNPSKLFLIFTGCWHKNKRGLPRKVSMNTSP